MRGVRSLTFLRRVVVTLALVGLFTIALPSQAHADVGSTIVGRLWESLLSTMEGRLQTNAPATVKLIQEAEKVFLGSTQDVSLLAPVRDVYKAMRVAGLLLLGLCTVISLADLSAASMEGRSANLMDWLRRFCIATFMTLGGIHFYSLWIRIFNGMLAGFRSQLDSLWTGSNDPSALYTWLLPHLNSANTLLTLVFVLLVLIVLFILWFLIGGVRMAEMAISVIIAPLVWPAYMIGSLEDLPRTAFRGFLGLNASLILIVGMLRLSVRMIAGGGIATTVWNFIPAVAMLMMTVFLPSIIKRLIGQGNTGAGGLFTAVSVLAGLKGVSAAAAGGASSVARPPAAASIPAAPSGASAHPPAPLPSTGIVPSYGNRAMTSDASVGDSPAALGPGHSISSAPSSQPLRVDPRSAIIDMGESKPGSGKFDLVKAIWAWQEGYDKGRD